MLGIPSEDPTYIYMDYKSVLINATALDSSLKKKIDSIAFHFAKEGLSQKKWSITYIHANENSADNLTKTLNCGVRQDNLARLTIDDIKVRIGLI